jgi:predicted alpha/beta-hydrolase family hydrolase
MGTYLAAGDDDHPAVEVCALVLYGYPLHPAGRPERLRAQHLLTIRMPMLFFTGSRDALALPELVDRWIRPLATADLEIIDDADHSFRVPKRSGWTESSLRDWMVGRTHEWIGGVCG